MNEKIKGKKYHTPRHSEQVTKFAFIREYRLKISAAFINDSFSVLTGVTRLNIIGAKLYKTILAVGERKRGFFIQKKGPFFLFRIAKILLALRRDAFQLETNRRLG
jgi:hypothetical protein